MPSLKESSSDLRLQRKIFFLLEQGFLWKVLNIFTFYTDLFCFVLLEAKSGAQLGLLLIQLVKNYSEHSGRVSKLSIKRKTFPQAVFGFGFFFPVSHKRSIVIFIARQRRYNLTFYYCFFVNFQCTLQFMSFLFISLMSM